MQRPRPYGRFSADALSGEDAHRVELLARGLTNAKDLGGLDSLRRGVVLPSGRKAFAADMGGVFRIVITSLRDEPAPDFDGVAGFAVPMLFSGVVTKATYRGEAKDGVGLRLTEQARMRVGGYGKGKPEDVPPKDVELQRFRVEYAGKFKYFEPPETAATKHTQYARLRPTWYSGAMAEVVQVVGGYGRQDMRLLPDTKLERASMRIPGKWLDRIKAELPNVRLPGYSGAPHPDGCITYDYNPYANNGVSFDSKGSPWLLRISAEGVDAMPLPMVPATTTKSFRAWMDDVGDDEILALLNRFGGMPSGEGFPVGEARKAWQRAGAVVRVCDTADFYQHIAMYPACGWSFNSKGTEAFNTCWDHAKNGLMHVYGYKMRLTLGEARGNGQLSNTLRLEDSAEQEALDRYLARIYRGLSELVSDEQMTSSHANAIKYKLRRIPPSELLARAEGFLRMVADSTGDTSVAEEKVRGEVESLDALELEPIASHSGAVSRVTSGPVYWPNRYPASSGRLKFPALTGEGGESFMLYSPDYDGPDGQCDTVMFGCYVKDQLQVVKFFRDAREFTKAEESTFEKHMIVGQWEKTVTTGVTGLMGNFYTSSFDDRKEASESTAYTKITGTDMGYGERAYRTPGAMMRVGDVYRARYYKHKVETKNTSSYLIDVAVCVPTFTRDAILYAFEEGAASVDQSTETEQYGIMDPTRYQFWTHDNIFHYLGVTSAGNQGSPFPKDGAPVYLDSMTYTPTEVSDFADSGNWYPLMGVIDITGIVGEWTSRSGGKHQAGGALIGGNAPGFVRERSQSQKLGETTGCVSISMDVAGNVQVNKAVPHGWYFALSPDPVAGYFYRDAVRITFGSARYATVSEKDDYGRQKQWGRTKLLSEPRAAHFIGVINE